MADTQVVFLGQKGEIRQGKVKGVSPETFAKALKKKESPTLLGKSLWRQKQRTLYFFGYMDGKAGSENQHHLPTPLEGMTFYGDIMVVISSSPNSYTSLLSLKTTDYESFYNSNLEGEEGEEDEGDSDEEGGLEDATEEVEEDDDAGVGGYDGESDDDAASASASADELDEEVALGGVAARAVEGVEKPVKATRVRKAVVTAVHEEPEVEEVSSYESSEHRIRVFNIISNTFDGMQTLEQDDKIALEEIIYKRACVVANYEEIRKSWNLQAFRDVYFATARRLIGNLNPSVYIKNKNLWERFAAKELTLEEIAKQNYYELCPENWQEMVDRQAKREKIQLEGDFSRATDKWTCNGCKKKKCTYYELQTRSADEPMTIFIHCLNCGKRWTQ